MISRLTASAALFAVLATAALTFASETQAQRLFAPRGVAARTARQAVVVLPTVVITGHRTH
jgi:hypothetical protein